ncbi:MAG: hypothetical protein KF862_06955 [Chitinophagaceae bacterium]|nr:hypothetical protein [Chitinophagaceae bacterium]
MNNMLSFHGKAEVKEFYLEKVKAYLAAGEIAEEACWRNGKGVVIDYDTHSVDHSAFEQEICIPEIIVQIEKRIFEGLPPSEARRFPLQFLQAIPVGKNLDAVWKFFFVWLLTDEKEGMINYAKKDEVKQAIVDIAEALNNSVTGRASALVFKKLKSTAAYVYMYAAASDDGSAAAAAYVYAAVNDATAAAYAVGACAYAAGDEDARENKYCAMRDQLLRLLAAA